MSSIKPARRWQPAFYPFKKEKFGKRLLAKIELIIKGPLFGCRMCGNCLLQKTSFICPMECPKGMRNGPCGGTTPEKKCYIDETRRCIWYSIYKQAEKHGREETLLEVLPPIDWEKAGTETWSEVIGNIREVTLTRFIKDVLSGDKVKKTKTWDSVFKTIRQPDWWKGDSDYHAPVCNEPVSELERRLRNGEFVVATEVTPPLNSYTGKLIKDIELVKPYVTAINFTDSSSARPRMSSIACSKVAVDSNAEPVFQIAARDTSRESGFNITAASEIMAILCLTRDLQDLKERLGNIFVGYRYDDTPVFARDLKANGAMAALLKDAIKPNLVQTLEGTPAIIHGGPFANIAQGTNSIIATKMGLTFSDYVVTEAGFASELGAEKFFNIKSRFGNLKTSAVVLVATIRALKYHGGLKLAELIKEDLNALKGGFENLDKHIDNIRQYGYNPVISINKFVADTEAEIEILREHCKAQNIDVAVNEGWARGGEGAIDLANLVVGSIGSNHSVLNTLYDLDWSFEKKIETIATKMYGADHVEYTVLAKQQLKKINELGLSNLAVCIAKTQKSLSDNEHKKGYPKGFTLKIREIELSSGAGFIIPIAGTIMRMPGLPSNPSAEKIDIDKHGKISGLF